MCTIIVATDRKFGIGKGGSIPFSSDYAFFKETTKGNTVIMGRKTWESLPKRPLSDRMNIVVSTRLPAGVFSLEEGGQRFYVVRSLLEAFRLSNEYNAEGKKFIIGGASLYQEAIDRDLVQEIIMTRFGSVHECDTFFPYHTADLEKLYPRWKTIEYNNDVEDPYIRTLYAK